MNDGTHDFPSSRQVKMSWSIFRYISTDSGPCSLKPLAEVNSIIEIVVIYEYSSALLDELEDTGWLASRYA